MIQRVEGDEGRGTVKVYSWLGLLHRLEASLYMEVRFVSRVWHLRSRSVRFFQRVGTLATFVPLSSRSAVRQ